MDDFPLAQEFDGIPHVGVVGKTENIVVGQSGFLLGAQIFIQVGNGISGYGEHVGIERSA